MNTKKQNDIDNVLKINDASNYIYKRQEIMHILLSDSEISLLLLDEIYRGHVLPNMSVLYWDDVDLVSPKYDERTITSISSDQNQTIGDMKKDIIEFCAKKKRKDEKHNNEIDNIIETLEEISELIGVDIFDMDWKNDEREEEDKKGFALYSLSCAINAIKKERK